MLLIVLLAEADLRLEDTLFQTTIPQHESLNVGAIELVIVCNVITVEEVKVSGIGEMLPHHRTRLIHMSDESGCGHIEWIAQSATVRLD